MAKILKAATSPKAAVKAIKAGLAASKKTAEKPAAKAKRQAANIAAVTAALAGGKGGKGKAKAKTPIASQKKGAKQIVSAKREKQIGVKPETAKGRVYAMAQRKNGVALADVVKAGVSINLVAARALIGDLRRMGYTLESKGDGVYKA